MRRYEGFSARLRPRGPIPDSTRIAQNGTAKETLRRAISLLSGACFEKTTSLRPCWRLHFCLSRGLVRSHLAWEHRRQNPGRPTVSTPATLTPVGYLQFENGGFYADNSPEFTTLFGSNRVTKLTVASRLQLLALSGPFAQTSGATSDALAGSRPGEVFAGFQAVILSGEGHKPLIMA